MFGAALGHHAVDSEHRLAVVDGLFVQLRTAGAEVAGHLRGDLLCTVRVDPPQGLHQRVREPPSPGASDGPASGPGVDGRGGGAEHRGEGRDVVRVTGEDVVAEADGADDQVGVHDIGGPGLGEKASDGPAVVEGMNGDGFQEVGQAGLTRAVTPDLGDDGVCGVQCGS
jgi:hypothetical protein